MSKKQKSKIGICAYCSESKLVTREHVIPRSYFQSLKNKTPIIVPVCQPCNTQAGKYQEWIRKWLCLLSAESNKTANDILTSKIKNSFFHNPRKADDLKKKILLVEATTPQGIYIGQKTKIQFSLEDQAKWKKVFDNLIRGLFFYHFKKPIPNQYNIIHNFFHDIFFRPNKKLLNFAVTELVLGHIVDKDVFLYRFNFVGQSYNSIWATVFYNRIFHTSFIVDNNFKQQFSKSS